MAKRKTPALSQLELPIPRHRAPDRNADKGGRSFYFFDFDDNVMLLDTCIYIFAKAGGNQIALSTRRFAEVHRHVGRAGIYADYEIRLDDATGSYRRFRDLPAAELDGQAQPFVEDLQAALAKGDLLWKGPSWDFFYHAVFNGRPIAIITARGHHPDTMQAGIDLLVGARHLTATPNYLGVYPVSHAGTRLALGDRDGRRSIPELKKAAILDSVRRAMASFGDNPHHRFGMSDDDPVNVALAVEAMTELKARYPENAFFVINTSTHPVEKTEILANRTTVEPIPAASQLHLFD
ncbi:MAG: hypothetical protein HY903_18035 [Deltaproteobacteria bacterium]|nr:hypothetical protein [Deltaproteobacteria bacterium]